MKIHTRLPFEDFEFLQKDNPFYYKKRKLTTLIRTPLEF